MRIAVLAVIIVSAFVSGAFAQKAPKWHVLAPANEEFSIEVPVKLSYLDDDSDETFSREFRNRSSDDDSREYRNRLEDTSFFIFSESRPDKHSSIKTGLEFIRQFDEKGTAVSLGRLEGRKFVFSEDEGFYHTAVFIKTKARTYLFHAVSEGRSSSAADRFISSLNIEEKELSQLNAPIPKTVPAEPADGVKEAASAGQGSGKGTGMGSGSGTGTGAGPMGGGPAPPDPATRPTHNVLIRSKPRASYTDAARVYDVQGNVTLRITFLADGTIGDVTPISRLPFGLTNQAITAARAIKFQPAQKEGIAYSKTMTIQYGFTIW